MESLQVGIKVLETRPALVVFNYLEIDTQLDLVLEKYKGLVFTEETVQDCKKTIAEIRKGQKAIDDFRKTTKTELTASVTAFEKSCNDLFKKCESVISPLTAQFEQFETDRKAEKKKQIREIIAALVQEHQLTEKWSKYFSIPAEYLTKSKTIKSIENELKAFANQLKTQQDTEAQAIEFIKGKVELVNAKYNLPVGLVDGAYVRMLDFHSVTNIVAQINADAETMQQREIQRQESLKAAPVVIPVSAPVEVPTPQVFSVEAATVPKVYEEPKKVVEAVITRETYVISGTEAQFDILEQFLKLNNYEWELK